MIALRHALLFLAVPGTVALAGPWWLARRLGVALSVGPLRMLGLALLLAGLTLLVLCMVQFGRHDGTPMPIDPPKRLVVRGPYRWVRNPMYVALATILLGQFLLHPHRGLVLYALAAMLAVALFVRLYEEPTLRRRFGAEYEDYVARVPRWWPRRPH